MRKTLAKRPLVERARWNMASVATGLLVILAACSGGQTIPPTETSQELPQRPEESVLVIRFVPGGLTEHSWQPASEWLQALNDLRASAASASGRIVLASTRPRDCDQEQIDCHRDCMRRRPPYPYGARRSHSHIKYCDKKCLDEYSDCLKLQKLEALSFPAIDGAADWLKRHQQEVIIGTTVVVAGAAFVVISAGAGLIVLAPLVLLT